MNALRKTINALLVCAAALLAGGCGDADNQTPAGEQRVVVVFTALDRVYSEPILERFTEQTGIEVRPVYDAEAAKTTGLINRLIARKGNPECDVLWNNELLQTVALMQMGVLEPYESPQAARYPAHTRDPQHRWHGFAARLRVIIYNTDLIDADATPGGLADFVKPENKGRAAIALPFFGTTFTHASVLEQVWGGDRLTGWLNALKANGVAIAPGNGAVRDLVAAGEYAFGLTDTDDAYNAMLDGKPVDVVLPDGEALLIPNTVALIKGAPHPDAGRALIDYLLSAEVERALAAARGAQLPLAEDLKDTPTPWAELMAGARVMKYDVEAAAAARQRVIVLLERAGLGR